MKEATMKRSIGAIATAAVWLLGGLLTAQAQQPPSASSPSLSLVPAVVILHAAFGQSFTQTITLSNGTSRNLDFEMSAQDVIVKNGKRVFVAAGELPHSIAASAVFSLRTGSVAAQSETSVQVILTVPPATDVRAVVVAFHAKNVATSHGVLTMNASLGSLVTFVLSNDATLQSEPVRVHAATAGTNLRVVEAFKNTGREPVVATGVAAFVDAGGLLAAKAPFESLRLLPGERLEFVAEYAGRLKPGLYRVLCSFQYEDKTVTDTGEFRSP
jgi:hypothetical protein